MDASWLPAGGAARPFGIVKFGRRVAGPACKSPMATVFDDQGSAKRPGDRFRRRQISMRVGFPNALPVCGLCQHPAVGQTIQSAGKARDRKNCSDKEKSAANFASGVSKPASCGHLRSWKLPWMQVCSLPTEPPGPSGSSNSVAGSRARLVSRRWRPFLTIKARQNALATNFAAGKFPCVWASPTPCPSAGFSTSCGRTDGLFSSLRRATGRTFGADGGVRCRRPRRGSADGGRSASHRCTHRLAKTERMALRRPLCFFASPRVRRRPWPGLPDAFAIKGTLPPPEPAVAPCPYMNNSRLTAITAMPPMRP